MGHKKTVSRAEMSEAQRELARKEEKARIVARQLGRPRQVFEHEFNRMVRKVEAMRKAGMTQQAMADATGGAVSDKQFSDILCGKRTTSYRATYEVIMAAQIGGGREDQFGARTPCVGSVRRLQALRAAGFPIKAPILEEISGVPAAALRTISAGGRAYVFYSTHVRIERLYDKLCDADPADYGITELSIRKAKTHARKGNMAPPMCWDADTIDDPDAFPEWTGACGSVTGYNLHRKHGINVNAWTDSRGKERYNVMCAACCSARTRERDRTADTLAKRRAEVVEMLADGWPYRKIALEVGMSTRTVQRVARQEGMKRGPEQGSEVDDS